MTIRDDGVRRSGRGERSGYVILAILLTVSVAALFEANGAADLKQMRADIAEARAWTFAAPACPSLSRQEYLANARENDVSVSRAFGFGGVRFGRGYGNVSCDMIHDDGGRSPETIPVCQFSSPGVLEVATPRGAFYFFPSTGPATVSVSHGEPRCVRGGTFRG